MDHQTSQRIFSARHSATEIHPDIILIPVLKFQLRKRQYDKGAVTGSCLDTTDAMLLKIIVSLISAMNSLTC